MWNARLNEAQAGIRIARISINNLRYADDTTFMVESEEELKSLLMKLKEESEKIGLKLNFKKTDIMASSPITSWQIDGETMETVTDFILGAPKSLRMVTAAMKLKDPCSLEEKLWQPRQHIKKQRHYFAKQGPPSQSYSVFPVVMYGCESWAKESWVLKKWCFWTVVLEKTWELLGQQGDPMSPS